jgi:hypothetical protein
VTLPSKRIKLKRRAREVSQFVYCQAMLCVDSAAIPPKYIRCQRDATVELNGAGLTWRIWVCEPCAKDLLTKKGKA